MIGIRPDLTFTVGQLAQFCKSRTSAQCSAAKYVLQYINATGDLEICFSGPSQLDINEFSDSDGADDARDMNSTSGHVFMMPGGAISWCFRKHIDLATSTG